MVLKSKNSLSEKNALTIEKETAWLSKLIDNRLESFFEDKKFKNLDEPILTDDESNYAKFIKNNHLNFLERLTLIVSVSVFFSPQIFDRFLIKNKVLDRPFTEFGGYIDPINNFFKPTLQTVTFINFGLDFLGKLQFQTLFDDDHVFKKENILLLENDKKNISYLNASISLTPEFIQYITLGTKFRPKYSTNFPANRLTTELNWENLILSENIMNELDTINTWICSNDIIDENKNLRTKINKGYKALLYGPPGTGKTLTAALLGKKNNIDVYRIDLSQLVSKYIGETEKNLSMIFDMAENKNWILFFDEAESMFSKRTKVSDSKDKFANQQTAYLLQRIENYKGLVILATNLKPNIDSAFSRRLQSVILYNLPNKSQRIQLWENALNGISKLDTSDIKYISENFNLSGGSIKNVVQYAWLKSLKKESDINKNDLILGIKRELIKEGKIFDIK